MSIQAPQGILNIPNAILRVGKLSVDEVVGADTILNTVARNTILLVDDVAYHENKNWALKLPNAWAGEFECNTASAGNYSEFNFYNEGASSNAQGYNLTFNDTTVELRYDGSLLTSGTLASTVTGTGVRKVRLMFERTILSVTVDGVLVFTHDDTGGPRPRVYSTTAGGFLNFFTNGGAIKNLKIVNEKWMSDGTSNIAYVGGGEVAVGQALAFNRVSNVSQIKVDANVVTEYTGPHDRPLRKYPEVLTVDVTPTSPIDATSPFMGKSQSWGGYTTIYSSRYNSNGDFNGIHVYDGALNTVNPWISGPATYSTSDGSATSSDTFQSTDGSYITLSLPNKIRLSHICIYNRDSAVTRPPKDGIIWGSSDGGATFTQIHTFSNLDPTRARKHTLHITSTTKYDTVVVQITAMTTTNNTDAVAIQEIEYYGYEEGSGSLDTTLKSVYNVPATTGTQLEVYYDAKDLADGAVTSVTDLSPNTNNATLGGDPQVSNGAFVFDGTGDAIVSSGTSTSLDGNATFSISLWSKTNAVSSGSNTLFMLGYWSNNKSIGFRIDASTGKYRFFTVGGVSKTSPTTALLNEWTHITLIHEGTSGYKFYVNGVFTDEITVDNDLSLDSNPRVVLGNYIDSNGDVTGTASYNGSIANFRLYSKALNADQVRELYDYQKDYFLGSKSQVTLYKGHLGVGVTEPSGQLELAGDERIQQYPPRAMTGYSTHIEGHGVFKAEGDTFYTILSPNLDAWRAFDNNISGNNRWRQVSNQFTAGSASSSGGPVDSRVYASGLPNASWLVLHLPYDVNLKGYSICPQNGQSPGNIQIWGSNDGGTSWSHLHSQTQTNGDNTAYQNYTITHEGHYSIIAYLILTLAPSTQAYPTATEVSIRDMKYFGTPGPTTLDKGSLSLGRSLDVPRVSRYDVDTETPRPEKLVVDFDTTVNSSPTDISGEGNHGTFKGTNMNYSSADKAFVFNGTDDYITSTINPSITGEFIHSFSIWLNFTALEGSYDYPIIIGSIGALNQSSILRTSGGLIGPSFGSGYNLFTSLVPDTNRWYHMVVIYRGGAVNTTNVDYYIDGVKQTLTGAGTGTLAIDENTLSLGDNPGGGNPFKGSISNFKLYNVALEPSEVKKLYNLGRTGRSMVISDTAVGIGKVPEAQLDVRGNLNVDGIITRPNQPMFSVSFTDNTNGYVSVGNDINWDKIEIDTHNAYSAPNYTIPFSGYWYFFCHLYSDSSGTSDDEVKMVFNSVSSVYDNGVAYSRTANTGFGNLILQSIRYSTAGETVKISVGLGRAHYNSSAIAYFRGFMIG